MRPYNRHNRNPKCKHLRQCSKQQPNTEENVVINMLIPIKHKTKHRCNKPKHTVGKRPKQLSWISPI